MGILIALVPAVMWGLMGTISMKLGGTAGQQTLGTALGALVLGIGVNWLYVIPHGIVLTPAIWLTGLLSGIFWAIGISGQYLAFKDLGVSVGLPLSTAGQIVTNALMAAAVLGEWTTGKMWLVGTLAVSAIVLGAILTSARKRYTLPHAAQKKISPTFRHGLLVLALSTVGFMFYFVFPNLMVKIGAVSAQTFHANGGITYMTAVVLPQACGQILGALFLMTVVFRETRLIIGRRSLTNILTGLCWAVGNLCMLLSAANPNVGQTTATALSQMCVLVGTYSGIFILHEAKSRSQMHKIAIGTLLMVMGGFLIATI